MSEISENISLVQARIKLACTRSKRGVDDVKLMVVSKHQPIELIEEAVATGLHVFGENKVQEGVEKVTHFLSNLEWHMIGKLQRNKVRKTLEYFDYIHGMESVKLMNYTNNVAIDLGKKVKVFLQVNIGREEQKSGFLAEELEQVFEQFLALENIEMVGLMCIPPVCNNPNEARKWFSQVRELRDKLSGLHKVPLSELSMGMSADYEIAIEEGATIVRVGSTIFGKRTY